MRDPRLYKQPSELGRGITQNTSTTTPSAIPSTEIPPSVDRAWARLDDLVTVSSSLCSFCGHDEQNSAHTTALTPGSTGSRSPRDLRLRASRGCRLCQCVLAATRLWEDDFPGEADKLRQVWIRFDKERFTVQGGASLPTIQIYTPVGKQSVYSWPVIPDHLMGTSKDNPESIDW